MNFKEIYLEILAIYHYGEEERVEQDSYELKIYVNLYKYQINRLKK